MQWKKKLVKATLWLVTEVILNLLGFDNLADYSEFLFEKEIAIATRQPQVIVVVPFRRPRFNYNLFGHYTMARNA